MNLLVLTQYFWPENFRINDLVRALRENGINVEVVTGQPNYPGGRVFKGYRSWHCRQESWGKVPVYRLPLIPRGSSSVTRIVLNYLSFVLSGLLLAPFFLRRKKVDVVFVYAISPILQAIPGILIKWIKGAKLVIWVQDLWPESIEATGYIRNRWLLAAVRVSVCWIYRHADLILVQSKAFIEPVATMADRAKIVYYPNSAEEVFSSYSMDDTCPVQGLDQGFSVVFAGNLGTAQAVETIIDAAVLLKETPDIHIFLVGDGSRMDWIREQIRMRGLSNVTLTGQYPLDAMPSILSRAGALLVTLKDQPIFCHTVPSKVQAYLAMGRPIIACLNGEGARIVMQANAGISCPAEDAAALASTIRHLSCMPHGEREKMGQNGKDYFNSNYESKSLTQVLIEHFKDLLRGGPEQAEAATNQRSKENS